MAETGRFMCKNVCGAVKERGGGKKRGKAQKDSMGGGRLVVVCGVVCCSVLQ